MLLMCCTQYVKKFRKLSNDHKTGKVGFHFNSKERAMPKNVLSTVWLFSFHMPVRLCSKSFKLGCSHMWTENFQMYKLGLEKKDRPEIKLPIFVGSWSKQGSSRKKKKKSNSSLLTTQKSLTLWVTTNWKILKKRWEYQTTLTVSWETSR